MLTLPPFQPQDLVNSHSSFPAQRKQSIFYPVLTTPLAPITLKLVQSYSVFIKENFDWCLSLPLDCKLHREQRWCSHSIVSQAPSKVPNSSQLLINVCWMNTWMIYIHATYHHEHNSLLEDRSYILFIFRSQYTLGPQDALVKGIYWVQREKGR